MTAKFAYLSHQSKAAGHGVLSVDQMLRAERAGLTAEDLIADGFLPPMAGGEDDDDDDDSDDDDDGDDDDGDDEGTRAKRKPKAKAKPARRRHGGADDDSDDDDGDDDSDDSDDDEPTRLRAELKAEKARAAKAEREARKLKRAEDRRKGREQADNGEYKELYEQEKARADGLETKLRKGALERSVTAAATDAGAKKPSKIIKLLDLDLDDVVDEDGEADEDAIKQAIRALKKSDRYLFKAEDAQTRDLGGERRNGGRRRTSREDVVGASRIRAAYDK